MITAMQMTLAEYCPISRHENKYSRSCLIVWLSFLIRRLWIQFLQS